MSLVGHDKRASTAAGALLPGAWDETTRSHGALSGPQATRAYIAGCTSLVQKAQVLAPTGIEDRQCGQSCSVTLAGIAF